MGRKGGGLPSAIVKKYGIGKKAWAVYRHGGGGRRRASRNPARRTSHRRMPKRGHSGRFMRRRKNPTGYAFSGRRYRPNYKLSRGAYRNKHPRASILPHTIRHRRSRAGHRSRKGRRNPAFGYSSGHGKTMGSIRNAVPLLRKSDLSLVWKHKVGSLVFGGVSYVVGGFMAEAGGTLAVLIESFGVAIVIRYVAKGEKWSYVAPAWALGGVLAAVSHVVTTGSLTGSRRLGDTIPNLKALAARVQVGGLDAFGKTALHGLSGSTSLKGLNLRLPGLKGLSGKLAESLGREQSTTTLTGLASARTTEQGWTVSA